MTSRCQGLFPSRPQAREMTLGTRLCFVEFSLLGNQQDVFLWFGNNGKRCYSLIPKKKKKKQNEEEKDAKSRVHFFFLTQNSVSFTDLDVSALAQLC